MRLYVVLTRAATIAVPLEADLAHRFKWRVVRSDAGRVRRLYAAIAAALFLGGFLYAFWKIGSAWPGVPPATDGIFHLKQVVPNA